MKFLLLVFISGLIWSEQPFRSLDGNIDCAFYSQEKRPKDYPKRAPLYLGWYTCKEDSFKSFYVYEIKGKESFEKWVKRTMKISLKFQKTEKLTHISPVSYMQGVQFIESSTFSRDSKVNYYYGFYYFRRNNKRYIISYVEDSTLFNRNKKQVLDRLKNIIAQKK